MKSIWQLLKDIKECYGDYRWIYLTTNDPKRLTILQKPYSKRASEIARMVEPTDESDWFDPVGDRHKTYLGTVENNLIYLGRDPGDYGFDYHCWGTRNGEIIKGYRINYKQKSYYYYEILALVLADGEEVLFDKRYLPKDT